MAVRTVGIDLAIRGAHVATIVDPNGSTVGRPVRFHLSAGDLTELVTRIRAGVAVEDQVMVVVEPTGMAWFPVARWLERAGCTVIRVKGARVKALRRYLSEHVKTDVIDAQLLGQLPRFGSQGLQALYVPSPSQEALNRLTKQRARYQEQICSTRRRLLDLVCWAAPALERALPDLATMVSLAVLDQYFHPARLLELGPEKLIMFLREHVGGNHPAQGEFAEQLAGRLREAAQATLDLHGKDSVDFDRLQLEVHQEIQLLRLWREHLHVLDREIATLYAQLDAQALLQSLPGIGKILGPSLLGVIHTWRRFGNRTRLRGFCGLFPKWNESGGVARGGQRITQGGNNRLKRDLIRLPTWPAPSIPNWRPCTTNAWWRKAITTVRPCVPSRRGSSTAFTQSSRAGGPITCGTSPDSPSPSPPGKPSSGSICRSHRLSASSAGAVLSLA
jgi:transposase